MPRFLIWQYKIQVPFSEMVKEYQMHGLGEHKYLNRSVKCEVSMAHPSGDVLQSEEDRSLTYVLKKAERFQWILMPKKSDVCQSAQ